MKHIAEYLKRAEASLQIASNCPYPGKSKWLAIAHDWLSLAKLRNECLAEQGSVRVERPADGAPGERPVPH